MKRSSSLLVLCCIWMVTIGAAAQTLPVPQGVLNLQASATVEVARDLLSITFTASREAPDAASVQAALKQALDAALAEARKSARPGQVDVQAGNFAVYPRHAPRGGIVGWIGNAEMTVHGRDMAAIAQLAGRIQTMTIARVGYALSRQARETVEAEVAAQAIARYRTKAEAIAKQFGYEGFAIREVHVSTDEPPPHAMPTAMMARDAAAPEQALPVEPGRGTVTATVSGSVQMK